jgi:hypothetical protein
MIHYKDMTFCTGAGCTKFSRCPKALTENVMKEARQWLGNTDVSIRRYENPTLLDCYDGGIKTQVFLRENKGE